MSRRILTLALLAFAALAAYHSPRLLGQPAVSTPVLPVAAVMTEVPPPTIEPESISILVPEIEPLTVPEVHSRPILKPTRPQALGILQMTPAGLPSPPAIAETQRLPPIDCF